MRVRIGKDIKIKWAVLTDGSALPLNKEELTLELVGPNGKSQSMEFEAEGNVLTTTFYGKDQNYTGDYMLTLWKNKGKEGQSVVDKTSAFSLVRYTPQEDHTQKYDNLNATLTDLGDTSLVTIYGPKPVALVCNLTGYKAVEDVSDLPMEPSTIGYLVGDNLYVYVGEGGDVRLGAYKNCGPFRGLKGDTGTQGPQGNSGYQGAAGELQVVNNLTEGGEAAALSAEQGKVLDGKKQDNLQTYHESGDYTETSIGVRNVILAQASCSDNTRSSLLLVDKDETDDPEQRVARLAVEKDGEGAFSSHVGAYGDKVQIGAPNVIINVTDSLQIGAGPSGGDNTGVHIEKGIVRVQTADGVTEIVANDEEGILLSGKKISMTSGEKTVKDVVRTILGHTDDIQKLQDDTEDLQSKKQDKFATIKEIGGVTTIQTYHIDTNGNGHDELIEVGSEDNCVHIKSYSEDSDSTSSIKVSADTGVTVLSPNGEIEDIVKAIQDNTNAVDILNGDGEGSVSKTVTDKIAEVVANAPADFDTLKEIADYIASDKTNAAEINNTLTALKTRVHDLGDFPSTGAAEAKAAEEAISRNPSISIIHYSVNHTTSHIILQDVNDNLTQQVLYYAGNTYIRHIGTGLNKNWKKTNPTNIKYNPVSHRIALMHMVNQYAEDANNIDWAELPTATITTDGLMTKEQVQSLEGVVGAILNKADRIEVEAIGKEVATKQNELTLTVLDNDNIRIGNLQGQTKEFMPATPSGDPMHYAYEALGAVYNSIGVDKTSTGMYGDTITHKACCWLVNEIGDLTNEEMRGIYNSAYKLKSASYLAGQFAHSNNRTVISLALTNQEYNAYNYIYNNAGLETAKIGWGDIAVYANHLQSAFFRARNLKKVLNTILMRQITSDNHVANTFKGASLLESIQLQELKTSISFADSPNLSADSVYFMVNKEASTSAIIITLHADAYARAMADSRIQTALAAHPNVSLASA